MLFLIFIGSSQVYIIVIVTMISESVKMYLGVALVRRFSKGYKKTATRLRFVGLKMVY